MTRYLPLLSLTLTACSGHDYTFGYGFMVGFTCGALITAIVVLALDRGES